MNFSCGAILSIIIIVLCIPQYSISFFHKAIYRLDIAAGNPHFDTYYLMRRKHCTSKSVSIRYIIIDLQWASWSCDPYNNIIIIDHTRQGGIDWRLSRRIWIIFYNSGKSFKFVDLLSRPNSQLKLKGVCLGLATFKSFNIAVWIRFPCMQWRAELRMYTQKINYSVH